MKSKVRQLEIMNDARQKEIELAYKATKDAEEQDIKRDEMIQERVIQLRELGEDRLNRVIERKQAANDDKARTGETSGGSSEAAG